MAAVVGSPPRGLSATPPCPAGPASGGAATFSSDFVRWVSAILFGLFLVTALLVFRRGREQAERVVRGSHPLSFVTGPLWTATMVVVFLSPLAEAIVPDWVYGGRLTLVLPFDSILQAVGLVAWLAGGAIAIAAERELGRFTRPEIEVLADHRLITAGPYRWVRHPLYTALLIMSAGMALLLLNPVLLVLFFVALGIARRRAFLEEQLLTSEAGFGMAYRAYMERTGRFLPRLGRRPPESEAKDNVR